MNGLLYQLRISLRLHFRNRMALLYSYLFPTIFLVAFWVLYRHELVPLAAHMGELLTVTALGGACFGLPTTMVSERERGVWRRYRLAPVPTWSLVVSTVVGRYVLLILAALLQLALALAIGMPLPRHPIALWVAFTFVAFAFLGLGLVIATLADNVPAVQALGQCIFLPMLIIGGVAVRLESLPAWAQHLSAFFPGRYAVEALQVSVTGDGLSAARFSLLALLLIGGAGCLAGAKMFRWEAQQRFAAREGRGWLAVALAAWAAVGLWAEAGGERAVVRRPAPWNRAASPAATVRTEPPASITEPLSPERATNVAELPMPSPPAVPSKSARRAPATRAPEAPAPPATRLPVATPEMTPSPGAGGAPASASPRTTAPPATEPEDAATADAEPASWRDVTMTHIERDFAFEHLPPDGGVVSPIASPGRDPDPELEEQLEEVRAALLDWEPGYVEDPVQRVRNFLFVAAVPDVLQLEPLERYVPLVVFARLQEDIPASQLIKLLYWVAKHPSEGDDAAVDQLRFLDLAGAPGDMAMTRERVTVYALKLLGRLTGKIESR
ncbi:MAG: hypothetical protein GEV06_03335 [Luteitalea sp.]|nr:hypothetical protein [Luteitalea sp.]